MTYLGLSITTWLISIAVYIIAVLLGTELVKAKFWFMDPKKNWHSLIVSWIIGLILTIGFTLWIAKKIEPMVFVIFIILTALLNKTYKEWGDLKEFIRKIFNRR